MYLQLKDNIAIKKNKTLNRKPSKKRGKKKFIKEYKNLLSEIYDTISVIIEENNHNVPTCTPTPPCRGGTCNEILSKIC